VHRPENLEQDTISEVQPGDVEQPDRMTIVAQEQGKLPPLSKPERASRGPFHPYALALLIPGSIFGLLARLGINALVNYPGSSVFSLAWVQGLGCFVMGFCLGVREPISEM
jgi:fluoride exporter